MLTYIAAGRDRGKFRHRVPGGETTVIAVPNKYDAVSLERRTVVAKIHGAVQRRALDQDLDSYVVTEDDYIECLTRTDIVELLPSSVVDRLVEHFGTLQKLLSAGVDDLQAVDGVGELRARSVREGLSRLAESSILERYV